MKRFLFSIAVSITCITIGFTSILFEFHSYEIVENKENTSVLTQTINAKDVLHNDRLEIRLEDSYLYADIRDDLKSTNEIVFEYPSHVEVDVKSDRVELEGNGYSSHSYRRFRDALDTFIDGLKEKKIYVNFAEASNHIVIHCSPELRSKIDIIYR